MWTYLRLPATDDGERLGCQMSGRSHTCVPGGFNLTRSPKTAPKGLPKNNPSSLKSPLLTTLLTTLSGAETVADMIPEEQPEGRRSRNIRMLYSVRSVRLFVQPNQCPGRYFPGETQPDPAPPSVHGSVPYAQC